MSDAEIAPKCERCSGETKFVMQIAGAKVRLYYCAACHYHTWQDVVETKPSDQA
jgi:hypothetical protein